MSGLPKQQEKSQKLADEIKEQKVDEKMDSTKSYKQSLTPNSMNPFIQKAQYAVRGEIVIKANKMNRDIKDGKIDTKKCGFNKIVMCNIGNPQAVGQIPLTYHRQVLATIMCPSLMKSNIFPNDVISRAKKLLSYTANGSIGAYTTSMGMYEIRQNVAKFIEKRDGNGIKSDPNNIFLTAGASQAIKCVFSCLITSKNDGILVPIPQYPLYSATVTYKRGTLLKYELNEDNDWEFNLNDTKKTVDNAIKNGIDVKAIVVINPGNPTGQCFTKKTMEDIIKFAYKYNICILADEVYQENIYDKKNNPFISFKKLIKTNKDKNIRDNLELISFHSCSKGIFGECGLRGGYMELTNINENAKNIFLKFCSINLCPSTVGQCMVDLMTNPPTKDTCKDSYKLFKEEYDKQYNSLKERAKIISDELNKVDGIKCNNVYGAMYAFPTINITDKAVKNIIKKYPTKQPDFVYCLELLEQYGICIVPGSGFGQKKNTFHFRTTLLPPVNEIKYVVQSIAKFHKEFNDKYESL